MSGSIQIPYAVGTKAWLASIRQDAEYVPCHACAGTLKHTVTLGNGHTEVVWCSDCGADRRYDYEFALDRREVVGKSRVYRIRAEVAEVTLDDVEVRGAEVNYKTRGPDSHTHYIYKCDGLFPTEAEARAYCDAVLVPEAQKREDERLASEVSPCRRSMRAERAAQKAAFWRRHRAEQVERLARIDARLARLKEVKS